MSLNTIEDVKCMILSEKDEFKYLIDTCPYGEVRGFNVSLPANCSPMYTRLLFNSHFGRYCMYLEDRVRYYGNNPYLSELCSNEPVVFSYFDQLVDFCRMLPTYG